MSDQTRGHRWIFWQRWWLLAEVLIGTSVVGAILLLGQCGLWWK